MSDPPPSAAILAQLEAQQPLLGQRIEGKTESLVPWDSIRARGEHELKMLEFITQVVMVAFVLALLAYGGLVIVAATTTASAAASAAAASLFEAIKVAVLPLVTLILGYYTGAKKG